jgi:hypothetical protein
MGCARNTNRHMTPDSRLSEQNYKKLQGKDWIYADGRRFLKKLKILIFNA